MSKRHKRTLNIWNKYREVCAIPVTNKTPTLKLSATLTGGMVSFFSCQLNIGKNIDRK